MAQLGGPRNETRTLAYLERNLTHWTDHGFGVWVLRALPSRQVVGRACVRHLMLDQRDEIEIGYGFLPANWGQGWATEIAQACADIAFSRLGCSSVVALTRPTNLASQRVLNKVGLVYERDVEFEGLRHRLFRRGPGFESDSAV